ncbi:MAG: M12 family metallo-peptidase [Phycisphaerae bacterium]
MTCYRFRTIGLIATIGTAGFFFLLISAGAGADDSSDGSSALPARSSAFKPVAMPVSLDLGSYAELKDRQHATLTDFVLDDGTPIELQLEQFDIFAPDATIVVGRRTGDAPLDRPPVALFRGYVPGEPDSHVFLSLSPFGVNGTIDMHDGVHDVSSGPFGDGFATVIYNLTTLPVGGIAWRSFVCASDELDPLIRGGGKRAAPGGGNGGSRARSGPCRIAEVAIETDWEFTGDLFDGDTAASSAYAAALLGAISEIYTRDVNTRLEISYLRVWSDSDDPWDQEDTLTQLYQFQDYWNAYMTDVPRNAAHFLSGRGLGGGVAYYPGLCYPEYDYGLSANLNGFFPYPIEHNHDQNWDLFVVGHELGHNFGAPHTHDQEPPVDGCAWGDCSVAPNATIMSYCHGCPGGLSNVRMEFHDQTINQYILPHLADPDTVALCDLVVDEVTIIDAPDDAVACEGGSVTFTVVASGFGPLDCQWRRDGEDIPGADQESYTISSVTFDDAGIYDVVVSNTCGSVTSAPATLTVCPSISGDLDHDCDVDLEDLATLLAHYGTPSGATYEDGDIDGDGDVDLSDLAALLGNYGTAGC